MNIMVDKQFHDIPRGAPLQASQVESIRQILSRLVAHCPAQRALVAESAGQVIASGGTEYFANPEGLAALIAGYMAAGQAIMYMTEPMTIDQLILREGQDTYTFLYEAGQHLILFVQVSKEVPLGWARLNVQDAGQQLANAIANPQEVADLEEFDWKPVDLSGEVDDALNSLWEGFA